MSKKMSIFITLYCFYSQMCGCTFDCKSKWIKNTNASGVTLQETRSQGLFCDQIELPQMWQTGTRLQHQEQLSSATTPW